MGGKRLPHFGAHEPQIREFIRGGYKEKREMYLSALLELERLARESGRLEAERDGLRRELDIANQALAAAKAKIEALEAVENERKKRCGYCRHFKHEVHAPSIGIMYVCDKQPVSIRPGDKACEYWAALDGDPDAT